MSTSLPPQEEGHLQNDALRLTDASSAPPPANQPRQPKTEPLYLKEIKELRTKRIQLESAKLDDRLEDLKLKRRIAAYLLWILTGSLVFLGVAIVLNSIWLIGITDSVLIALISFVGVNVIGLVLIVVKYLFPTETNHLDEHNPNSFLNRATDTVSPEDVEKAA